MTTLDKTIPYYPVLMELTELPEKMEYHLAEGYRVIPFDARYSQDWVRLHVALGQLANFAQGMQYFKETFLSQPEKVKKQMLLVVDENGRLAGTSSVWEGEHFGHTRMRVHWVGVDEHHQRKGIAKALMIETIRLYASMQVTEPQYLTTQTNSYVAIAMYLRLGFTPYKKAMPVNFQADPKTFEKDTALAWKLIMDKIAEIA